MRALGRADDPTTGAKRLLVFTEEGAKYGQTVNGFTEEDMGLGSSATTGSPIAPAHLWAADTHPYVGRWVVPTTQRPLSELPQTTKCQKLPVPCGELVLAQLAVVGFSTLLERA